MNDPISIREALCAVAPRFAISRAALFDVYAEDEGHLSGDACLLLEAGCTFSRADAAQFRRLMAERLGCTVDVMMRSALVGEAALRADEARVLYEREGTLPGAAAPEPPHAPTPPQR